jgi:hypothetical protein
MRVTKPKPPDPRKVAGDEKRLVERLKYLLEDMRLEAQNAALISAERARGVLVAMNMLQEFLNKETGKP